MVKNNGCCDLEYAEELRDLGIKQESLWYWHNFGDKEKDCYKLGHKGDSRWRLYSAFTVAELGELLPVYIELKGRGSAYLDSFKHTDCWVISYRVGRARADTREEAGTEANARAKMLIYLIKNNLIRLGIEKGV